MKFLQLLILAALLAPAGFEAAAASLDERIADAQKLIRARVENKWNVGIVVGIIDETGTRVAAYGSFKKNSEQKLDGDTLFEIGSITKTFTGILLADMAERGEVKLDDPVSKHLPAEVRVPEKNGRKITLQHLSQHSSGLPRLPDNFKPANPRDPYADYTVKQMYEFLSKCELRSEIGEKYDYSNLGTGLLGHVLSLKAGSDYETLVVSRICDPLSLKSTRITLSPELKARLAMGYNEQGVEESNWHLPALAGAGALRSSANDMLLYLGANLGLKAAELSKAIENSHKVSFTSQGMQCGLGWHVVSRDGIEIITHSGGTGGYRSFAGFIKSKKLGVVVLTNTAREVDDIGMHLLEPKIKTLEKFNTPRAELKEVKVDPKIYDAYAGKYELSPGAVFEITREGDRLMAQLTGQPKLEVFPQSETQFFYKEVEAQITFNKDEKGQVSHLELSQNGLKMKAWNTKFPRPQEKEVKVDAKILEQYAGQYELAPGFVFTITVEDQKLMAQLTGQPKMQVFAESETKFSYRIVEAVLMFMKDNKGKVTHLVLQQGGIEQKAARK